MSNLIKDKEISDSKDCPAVAHSPILQKLPTRNAQIGEGLEIKRALPHKERRMIGAWCFFDHFGPVNLKKDELDIAPHPHMGLQTFTWTVAGEILHRDSLGSEQIIKPGQVNLMTAGHGIAHSEESQPDTTLHGVQLWIAMPNHVRNDPPEFFHYPKMPIHEQDQLRITVVAGEYEGKQAPTKIYTPLVGLNLHALQHTKTTLSLNPKFEYGLLSLHQPIKVENEAIDVDHLLYLGCGREKLSIEIPKDTHVFLIGGEPFKEEVLLWWNFVARTPEEIALAIQQWENQERFGKVLGYHGERLFPNKSYQKPL